MYTVSWCVRRSLALELIEAGAFRDNRIMPDSNPMFLGLVASLHSSGMIQLGRLANPMTGKVERDLTGVRQTIDLLEMLQTKTRANLSDEESRFLEHALFELRMNFLEESRHPASAVSDKDSPPPENPAN